MTDRLAWEQMMRLGLGTLRLAPDAFWAMTPVEFLRALEGAGVLGASAPPTRGELERLMARHPDFPTTMEEPDA